mmetsp:Transcript_43296/g.55613  ORF Transcript_43296/g.55613 Transcript_43296/m.55613 type:complete len:477 (+) Transcript_43296:51-1481(+)
MLRLARLRAKDYGRTSEEDTLDLIKLIIEWRGRVSIVTEADEFYAAEKLSLNPENAKGLLDLYEIIGPGAGYVTPSYDDDDEEDDDESSRRRRGGEEPVSGEESDGDTNFNDAGEVMEAFNLKEEREQGHFDDSGNYIWRKLEEVSDEWLQSMGGEAGMEAAIGQAAAAQRRQKRELASKEAEKDRVGEKDVLTLFKEIHSLLLDEESVTKAMKRLSPPKKKTKQQQQQEEAQRKGGKGKMNKNNKNNSGIMIKSVEEMTFEEVRNLRKSFEDFTELADALLRQGEVNVYQFTKEEIEEKIEQLDQVNNAMLQFTSHTQDNTQQEVSSATTSQVQWEYQGADGQIHGPYETDVMQAWRLQGFFTGESAVMMRKCAVNNVVAMEGSSDSATTLMEESSPKNNVDDLMADFDSDDDETNETVKQNSGTKKSVGAFGSLLETMNKPNEDDMDEGESSHKKMKTENENPWMLSDSIDFQL